MIWRGCCALTTERPSPGSFELRAVYRDARRITNRPRLKRGLACRRLNMAWHFREHRLWCVLKPHRSTSPRLGHRRALVAHDALRHEHPVQHLAGLQELDGLIVCSAQAQRVDLVIEFRDGAP